MDHNTEVLQSINNVKLPVGKTIALYQSAQTHKYCQMDISDVHKTMVEEIGDDYMSAGIVTAIVSLATKDDSLSFHWGSATDCIDYLLEMASDHDEEYRQLEDMTERNSKLIIAKDDLKRNLKRVLEENVQLELRLEESRQVKILAEEAIEEENNRIRSADEKSVNKQWLKNFGWSEENTGGGTMVMFKDFMCADGKIRAVAINGETQDGGLYPMSYKDWQIMDDDVDCVSTDENETLCQFQRDEINVANGYYWDC